MTPSMTGAQCGVTAACDPTRDWDKLRNLAIQHMQAAGTSDCGTPATAKCVRLRDLLTQVNVASHLASPRCKLALQQDVQGCAQGYLDDEKLFLVGRLASGPGREKAWGLHVQDETGSVRAIFTHPGPTPQTLGELVVLVDWQCVQGAGSGSKRGRGDRGSSTAPGSEVVILEVSDWRLLPSTLDGGSHITRKGSKRCDTGEAQLAGRKRRREEPAVGTVELTVPLAPAIEKKTLQLSVCGVLEVVSAVLPCSSSAGSGSNGSGDSVVVILNVVTPTIHRCCHNRHHEEMGLEEEEDEGGQAADDNAAHPSRFVIVLRGELIRHQPLLTVGRVYRIPHVQAVEGCSQLQPCACEGASSIPPKLVFECIAPPQEVQGVEAVHGLFLHGADGARLSVPVEPTNTSSAATDGRYIPSREHPHGVVVSFEGVIKRAHRNGMYDLDDYVEEATRRSKTEKSNRDKDVQSQRKLCLMLSPASSAVLGAGLREGAHVRLHNVHPICLWGQVMALGTCEQSQVQLLGLGTPGAAYIVPQISPFRHKSLAYLEWTRRLFSQLSSKVGRAGHQQPQQLQAALQVALSEWTKCFMSCGELRPRRLPPPQPPPPSPTNPTRSSSWLSPAGASVVVHVNSLRLSDMEKEMSMHGTMACPSVYGGLPECDKDEGQMSPDLPSLPTIRQIREAAVERCKEMASAWVGEVRPQAKGIRWARTGLHVRSRKEFIVLGSVSGLDGLLQPCTVMGQLCVQSVSGKSNASMSLKDVTGSLGLVLTVGEEGPHGEAAIVSGTGLMTELEGIRGAVGEDMTFNERIGLPLSGLADVNNLKTLPWCRDEAVDANANSMIALKGAAVQVLAEIEVASEGADLEGGTTCVNVDVQMGVGLTARIAVRIHLLARARDVIALQKIPSSEEQRGPTVDTVSARVEPQTSLCDLLTLRVEDARSQKQSVAPPFFAVVLACERVSRPQGGAEGTTNGAVVLLYCRSLHKEDGQMVRVALKGDMAARQACQHGVAPLQPLPGCVIACEGLRQRPDTRALELDTPAGWDWQVRVVGYRQLTTSDAVLLSAHYNLRSPAGAVHLTPYDRDAADPFAGLRSTPIAHIARAQWLHLGVSRLVCRVVSFKPICVLHPLCPDCGGKAWECPRGCTSVPEPRWEAHCTIDDGTGQATLMADGDVAVSLLGVDVALRRELEGAVRDRATIKEKATGRSTQLSSAPSFMRGGRPPPQAGPWSSYIWDKLMRSPSDRARRLRRIVVVVKEVLSGRGGKGSGSSAVAVVEGGGGLKLETRTLHMPMLKAVFVHEADAAVNAVRARLEAHRLAEKLGVELGSGGIAKKVEDVVGAKMQHAPTDMTHAAAWDGRPLGC